MAVTITVEQLQAALRLGSTVEETAEVTRLLAYATEAVTKYAASTPTVTANEAVRRLAGYLFDQPEAGRGDSYANALRNSGAARILLPYRIHRLGLPGETVAESTDVVASPGGFSLTLVGMDTVGRYQRGGVVCHHDRRSDYRLHWRFDCWSTGNGRDCHIPE